MTCSASGLSSGVGLIDAVLRRSFQIDSERVANLTAKR